MSVPHLTALIDRSISELQHLASVMAREVRDAGLEGPLREEILRRKEALLTISVLLPKLSAARGEGEPGTERSR